MGYPIDQCCLPDDQKEELKCELCLDILENPKSLVPCVGTDPGKRGMKNEIFFFKELRAEILGGNRLWSN